MQTTEKIIKMLKMISDEKVLVKIYTMVEFWLEFQQETEGGGLKCTE